MKKVLVIEDNQEVAGILFDYFESAGVELDYAANGELGLKLALEQRFDLILLDLMLPRMDGKRVCRELRRQGVNVPVLMLTALNSKDDMLTGFDCGADDYLTKPFDLAILEARMNALIRRYQGNVASSVISFGALRLDQKSRKASREGKPLQLNPTTFTILEMLCQKAPDVVTREEIIDKLWGGELPSADVLRSHIYQLRAQLDKPFASAMLTTVPKVGFQLEVAE